MVNTDQCREQPAEGTRYGLEMIHADPCTCPPVQIAVSPSVEMIHECHCHDSTRGRLHIPAAFGPELPPTAQAAIAEAAAPLIRPDAIRIPGIASLAGALIDELCTPGNTEITVSPLARERLADLTGAALALLLDHAVTTDDEQHLEAFVNTFMAASRLPDEAVAAIGPALAGIVGVVVPVIVAAREAEAANAS